MKVIVMTGKAVVACMLASLAACGGGGSDPVSNTGSDTAVKVSGTVVVPESLNVTAKQVLDPVAPERWTKSDECPSVPEGYQPAAQASVELLAADNSVVSTTTADACGKFELDATDTARQVRVTPAGHQPIEVPVASATDDTVLSALPDGAQYEIAALQFVGADRLSALVVDSVTKKAVLGLAAGSISARVGDTGIPVTGTSSRGTALNTQPFSVTIVLDSSGSMTTCAANCPGDPGFDTNNERFDRFQLVAKAAHSFLDGKKEDDETSLLAFSSNIYRLDNAQFAGAMKDAAGNTVDYAISADGFTTDSDALRLPVDYYNRYSTFWSTDGDALHPATLGTGLVPSRRSYPLSGATALYSAVVDGLNWITSRANQRRILIAMTDGINNAGSETLESAIQSAGSASVPVYTIGYGLDPARLSEARAIESLRELALQTGAQTSVVNGTDIVGLFAGLQTAIRFETEVQLAQPLTAGQIIVVSVTTGNGAAASGEATVPSSFP